TGSRRRNAPRHELAGSSSSWRCLRGAKPSTRSAGLSLPDRRGAPCPRTRPADNPGQAPAVAQTRARHASPLHPDGRPAEAPRTIVRRMDELSEEQVIDRLFTLENDGLAEQRAELTGERFLSLVQDHDSGR